MPLRNSFFYQRKKIKLISPNTEVAMIIVFAEKRGEKSPRNTEKFHQETEKFHQESSSLSCCFEIDSLPFALFSQNGEGAVAQW